MDWVERAEKEIEEEYEAGHLTDKQYNQAQRELRQEIRAEAEDAYDEVMNRY